MVVDYPDLYKLYSNRQIRFYANFFSKRRHSDLLTWEERGVNIPSTKRGQRDVSPLYQEGMPWRHAVGLRGVL